MRIQHHIYRVMTQDEKQARKLTGRCYLLVVSFWTLDEVAAYLLRHPDHLVM